MYDILLKIVQINDTLTRRKLQKTLVTLLLGFYKKSSEFERRTEEIVDVSLSLVVSTSIVDRIVANVDIVMVLNVYVKI